MKNFKYLFISIYLLTACVKDLPENNPFHGTPIVATYRVYESFATSFKVEGYIISTDEEEIIEKGFCWSTDTLPTILNQKTSVTFESIGGDNFYSKITDFQQVTLYHIRSYAKTNFRVVYGNDISFTTNGYGKNIKDIDGNIYKTVQIGDQIWMAENLKVSKFNNGTPIPNITDDNLWGINTTSAWAYYNNDATNNAKYGKLYNWYAVSETTNGNKNVCPTGWHVPTNAEWTVLTDYLGGGSVAGGKMKEVGTTNWYSPNTDATNTSLFTGLPGGGRVHSGVHNYIGRYGNWWSSTETGNYSAWGHYLNSYDGIANRDNFNKIDGLSVRCLKD
jgi:uncharacterized protein (TIGR02145 family)